MNVSISAVVEDLDTTVSGVQSAIALEALVSAAFILIGSKIGDLFGRKRAYVLGLLGYALGALSMALAQSLTAIVFFWAILGGLGASLLLPAMQSLIHGNFEGAAQRRVYALVGAAAAVAAAVGPLLGGFITTYMSYRVAFLLEVVVIAIVLSGIKLVHDVPYTGSRKVDVVGSILSVLAMGGTVLGILAWQEGGDAVAELLVIGAAAMATLVWWLVRRKREQKPTLLDPDLFKSLLFRYGVTGQMLQQIALGGTMIALPIYLQMVLEYNAMEAGLSLAPLSLSMFAVALVAGKRAGDRRPAAIIQWGFALLTAGDGAAAPDRAPGRSGWALVIPLIIAGCGLGLLVSQLNNYTLSPISEERVSEAAGVNSAAGSFGLSFGLAFAGAIMLAALSLTFTAMADDSTVLAPAEQDRVATALEDDAEVMTNTHLEELLVDEPPATQAEIIRINTDARPLALQIALAHPDPRRRPRPGQLEPHEARPRPGALVSRRRHPGRLTRSAAGSAVRRGLILGVCQAPARPFEPGGPMAQPTSAPTGLRSGNPALSEKFVEANLTARGHALDDRGRREHQDPGPAHRAGGRRRLGMGRRRRARRRRPRERLRQHHRHHPRRVLAGQLRCPVPRHHDRPCSRRGRRCSGSSTPSARASASGPSRRCSMPRPTGSSARRSSRRCASSSPRSSCTSPGSSSPPRRWRSPSSPAWAASRCSTSSCSSSRSSTGTGSTATSSARSASP